MAQIDAVPNSLTSERKQLPDHCALFVLPERPDYCTLPHDCYHRKWKVGNIDLPMLYHLAPNFHIIAILVHFSTFKIQVF